MNPFEKGICRYLDEERLKTFRSVRIGIAGAGGLGSNCALCLVQSGFQNLIIVDHDVVEASNLNRQFYFSRQIGRPKVDMLKANLVAVNPEARIRVHCRRITPLNLGAFFDDCDVLVEAFDEPACKKMIVERYMNSDKLLVAASGIAGSGNTDRIQIHKIRPRFYIVGDLESEAGENLPPFSPGVSIAAAKQADVILNYYLNQQP
jgi:sulfur carrier protein ThiS adenylyltransferase